MEVKEAAEYLGVSRQRVWYLAKSGKLKMSSRVRNRLRLERSSVEAYSTSRLAFSHGDGSHDPVGQAPDPHLTEVLGSMFRIGGTSDE